MFKRYFVLFIAFTHLTVSLCHAENYHVLGRGLEDKNNGFILQIACTKVEEECKEVQFLLTRPEGTQSLIGLPFMFNFDQKKKKQIKAYFKNLEKVYSPVKQQHFGRLKEYSVTTGAMAGVAMLMGAPLYAAGIVLAPGVLIFGIIGLVEHQQDAINGEAFLNYFGSDYSLEDREKKTWQFRPEKVSAKTFHSTLRLISMGKSYDHWILKERCSYSGLTVEYNKHSHLNVDLDKPSFPSWYIHNEFRMRDFVSDEEIIQEAISEKYNVSSKIANAPRLKFKMERFTSDHIVFHEYEDGVLTPKTVPHHMKGGYKISLESDGIVLGEVYSRNGRLPKMMKKLLKKMPKTPVGCVTP